MRNAVTEAIARLGGITGAIQATGVSASTWQRYRRRGRIYDAHLVFKVAQLTGIDARALAGIEHEEPPPPPASSPEPTAAGSKGSVRRLPRRRDEGPRVYGTIRGRNNWPLFQIAA